MRARSGGPLAGLRVLELATGVAGAYGGRLLALLGARVVKLEAAGGDPLEAQPIESGALEGLSPLHVHLNTGKRRVRRDRVPLGRALRWADVAIESRVRHELDGTALDPNRLSRLPHPPVLVTTSAWGFEAPDAGIVTDELLVQALSGAMSTTGDPDGPPLRLPGFQAQMLSGAYVAAAALAALRSPGSRHVDVPWVACMASGVEGSWSRNLQTDSREPPGGPHQLGLFPSGALPCADGFVVPGTVRPSDWVAQCGVYERPDLLTDERFRSRGRRTRNHAELWNTLRPWYAARTRDQIFRAALDAGWACGMVVRGTDALVDPHLRARGFLTQQTLPDRSVISQPRRPWLGPDLPAGRARLSVAGEDDGWFESAAYDERPATPPRAPLSGVRVLELTQAWAGPFVGRFLGAFGADVVKVESARRPDGWRGPSPFGLMAPHLDVDPKSFSVEIGPNFNTLNRNKRHCSIDLRHEHGRAVFLDLVGAADVVVANMTARVLPDLRLAYADLAAANPRIILIHMPALGATGPYRGAAGYGTVVEGMGGLGALFGAPEEGARITQTYYPDPVAGLHASVAVLSMLERRERTNEGGEVDLSHQETLWLQLGEALVSASRGRDPERMGNAVPGAATSGVFPTNDGRWVAVSSSVACDDLVAESDHETADALLTALAERGARAVPVLHFAEARDAEPMRRWIEHLHHPVTLERPYLRVPLTVDGARLDSRRPSPLFDQDTDEVLKEWLGLDPDEIGALRLTDAVGGAPDPDGLRDFYLKRSRS